MHVCMHACMHTCMHTHIHVCMHAYTHTCKDPTIPEETREEVRAHKQTPRTAMRHQEGTGSVRFVSVPSFLQNHSFGSVWFGTYFFLFDAVRPALFEHVMVRPGSVRFGSAFGSGQFRNQTVRFGSVRFGRFDSVSYSFLKHTNPSTSPKSRVQMMSCCNSFGRVCAERMAQAPWCFCGP